MPQHFGHSSTFSVGPAHSYPMKFSFNFYLKHFRSSVVDYILEETGYSELIEYETLCRKTDLFPVYISTNGLLCCDYPIVDETKNKVFALSLHHVRNEVRDWIMEHYIGMNITDYELQYSQYNSIYVVVPYSQYVSDIDRDAESNRGFVIHLDECDCSDEDEHKTDDGDSVYTDSDTDTESDWESVDEEVTQKRPNFQEPLPKFTVTAATKSKTSSGKTITKPLDGWSFKMNTSTNNSYILYISNYDKVVVRPDNTWHLELPGLERPLYFNTKAGGWIVSLRLKQALLDAGAKLVA